MPTMEDFRQHRQMPFVKRGMRVRNTYTGKHGRVAGANSSGNLNIIFDGEKRRINCHPCWMMEYYDNAGNVVANYRD